MLKAAYDPKNAVFVASLAGSKGDEEYGALERSVRTVLRDATARPDGILFLLVLEDGTDPPSALWRKRLALARATEPHVPRLCAYITTTPMLHFMLTAIQWVMPAPDASRAVIMRSWPDAREWARQACTPERLAVLDRLRGELSCAPSAAHLRAAARSAAHQ